MKPIPIPDKYLYDDMKRLDLGAPPGLEDQVRPLECGSVMGDDLGHEFWVLMELDEEDIKRKKVWVVIISEIFFPIASATAYEKGELIGD